MSAARKKKTEATFTSYKSGREIASIYNSISSSTYKDKSLVLATLYLLNEICLKKLSIHFGYGVATNNHTVTGYLSNLKDYNVDLQVYASYMSSVGRFRLLQSFNYDDVRFNSNVNFRKYPTIEEMVKLFEILFEWLKVVERQRGL